MKPSIISLRSSILVAGALTAFAATLAAQTDTTETSVTPETAPPRTNTVQAGVGFDYSRGAYGFAEDTEVFSVPLTLTYNMEKWILRASVPYVRIEGPADAVGAGGSAGGGSGGGGGGLGGVVPGLPGAGGSSTPSVINTPARPNAQAESGLGDVMLGATRMLGPVLGPVHVDLTARVKLPTADDDKGLGTGGTDFYGQADFYYVGTRFIPFATLGYRVMGDSDRYELENGVYASAGSAVRVGEKTRVGASLDWRSRIVDGGDDATEVSVFLAHDIDASWNLILYALAGMTDASPDFGMGGSVSYRF